MRFLGSLARGRFLRFILRAARVMLGKRWRSISRTIDLGSVVPEALFRKIDIRWSTRLLWIPPVKSHVSLGDTMFLSQISFLQLIASLSGKVFSLVQSLPIQYFISLHLPFISQYTMFRCSGNDVEWINFQGPINCRRWCRWALPWLAPGSR